MDMTAFHFHLQYCYSALALGVDFMRHHSDAKQGAKQDPDLYFSIVLECCITVILYIISLCDQISLYCYIAVLSSDKE